MPPSLLQLCCWWRRRRRKVGNKPEEGIMIKKNKIINLIMS